MIDYTKEELVELLRKNPEKFNEWKLSQEEEVNLSETDFSSMTLNEIDFSDVNLNSSSFADCSLSLINFNNADLTSVDFTRSHIVECDFTDSLMCGADCSYAFMSFCNFTDTDLAGCVLSETDLSNSDLTAAVNLDAARFDDETAWPEPEYLPDGFNPVCGRDLSSLQDDEDEAGMMSDY